MGDTHNVDPALVNGADVPVDARSILPVTGRVPVPAIVASGRVQRKRRWFRGAAVLLLLATTAGGLYWWAHRPPPLPAGIAVGNGRIEADPIDVATKFAGRVFELRVDEGDVVKAGQVLAIMDTRDLAESLKKARAQVALWEKSVGEAKANLEQIRSQVVLANQEMDRTTHLFKNGWATRELFDQRRQQLNAARATEAAGVARVNVAEHALDAALHDVALYEVNIADNTLVAPRDGRVEYRIANVGEVLPAGGKVFTMLDTAYVYMDIYLPTLTAGRVRVGDDARIVLDAYPDDPMTARVTFVASQAQFTPKMVETQSERDKLMFRVRVRIDPNRPEGHAGSMTSGLPGIAYVRFDPKAAWPERLQGKS